MPTVKLTTQQFKDDIFDYTQENNGNTRAQSPPSSISMPTGVDRVKWSLPYLKNLATRTMRL